VSLKDDLDFPRSEAVIESLENGLEIILLEDHAAPVVSMQAWCRAGSIDEGPLLGSGASHFVEHMLFKGTARRTANEIAQTVQSEGGYINAYTSFDRTVYWIDTPSTGTKTCLDVLCDVVGFAEIPEDEFANEADVIRREIAMGLDSPDQQISRHLFSTAYAAHPCRYPVIGHLDLFNQLTRGDLYAYYREKYSPDNLFLVLVGAFDREEVLDQIQEALGSLERRRRNPVAIPAEPQQQGLRTRSVGFPTDLWRSRIAWPIPDGGHVDVPAIDLLVSILGDGRSSRLYQSIREEKELAHSVGAYAYTPSFPGQLVLSFDTEPEKQEAAKEAVFAEVQKICEGGVTEDELVKAQYQALSSQFSTLTDVRGKASDLGSNWMLTRNLDYTRDYVRQLEAVDRDSVLRVANQYLQPDCYTEVSLVPKEVEQEKAEVAARRSRSEDVRRVELENGLTLLLLSDRRVPFVQASGVFRGGLLAETAEKNGLTRLMARLLVKDSQQRSAEAIAESIESVGGGIGSSIGNNTFGVSTYAMRPDLDRVVGLLGETLLTPAFLEDRLEKERGFQLTQIKAEADRPFSVAMKRLRKEIYGDHPYALEMSGTEDSLGNLGRDDIVGLHDRLVRGGNGVVGLFGDLDLDAGEELLRTMFSERLKPGPREFEERLAIELPQGGGRIIELEHEKEQAVLLIGYRTVELTHPDNPALEMIDEACSDMASRMFIRIREELGLAYSVGSTRMQGLEPGMILFYASTAPEKLDRVQEEMLSEIELMRNEGLVEEEFERAKASWLGKEVIQLQGVKELAATATIDELVGLGWDHYRKTPDTVRALTHEQIQEVASRYLTEDNRVIVRLSS